MTQNTQQPGNLDGAILAVIDKISSRGTTGDMLLQLAIPIESGPKLVPFLSKIGKHVGVAFADLEADAAALPASDEKILAVVDKLASRSSTSDWLLTLSIPLDKATQFAPYLSKVNQHVAVAFGNVDQKRTPAAPKAHDYGEFARVLFQKGFFRSPHVRTALGLVGEHAHDYVAKQVAAGLGYESMGDVPPQEFLSWAKSHQLEWMLPVSLRNQH